MGVYKDITGNRFGRLTALSRSEKKGKNGCAYWECACDCGNTKTISMSALNRGYTQSCGCLKRELLQNSRHKNKRLYQVWQDLKQRCYNPNNKYYYRYGGRGITVCEEWQTDYEPFYTWAIKNGYKRGLQIDRIDRDGNYEPSNCRWVSAKVNTDNRDATIMLTHKGKTRPLSEWSRITGTPLTTIRDRYRRGMKGDSLFAPRAKPPITIDHQGKTQRLTEWCKELNIPYGKAKARYYAGKPAEEILKP